MKKIIRTWLCSIGIYELLFIVWTFAEKLETGTAITTIADTVIFAAVSILVAVSLFYD